MKVSREIDWVAAWYDNWAVIDSTLNFWITATFAVIVAIHALGDRATKRVTRPVAALYASFSLYTGSRMMVIYTEASKIGQELNSEDIDFFAAFTDRFSWRLVSDITLLVTFFIGTLYAIYFVLTASNRVDT